MGKYLDIWDVTQGQPEARKELMELLRTRDRYDKIRGMKLSDLYHILIAVSVGEGRFDDVVDRYET